MTYFDDEYSCVCEKRTIDSQSFTAHINKNDGGFMRSFTHNEQLGIYLFIKSYTNCKCCSSWCCKLYVRID